MDWLIDQKITCLFFWLLHCVTSVILYSTTICCTRQCETRCMWAKKKINGTISDMQNPIDHTNQVSANKHKSALNYGHSKNVCTYDLIGNNIFMEECTRDNTNNWAIIPTGDFIHLFISNTEAPFLYYHTSRFLQIEGKKMSMYFQIGVFFAVVDIVFCGWCCLWSCFCS